MTAREAKLYRRANVIRYRNSGYPPDEIEEHTDYSEREQRNWVRRYREEGVDGLYDRPRSGRPRGHISREQGTHPSVGKETPQVEQAERTAPGEEDQQAAPVPPSPPETSHPSLSTWARLTLESMQAYHPTRYLRQRAQMVLLREKGYSADEIADILDVTSGTVRQIWAGYDRHQLGGLYRQPGSGRPSKLTNEKWEQFAAWVKAGPKALGYRCVTWTTRSLRTYIFKRCTIRFSREWIRQKLHHFVGDSWTRGKKVYAYPDDPTRQADRQRFSQNMLVSLERAHNGEIILLFEDERIVTQVGEVGYSWSPEGETQEVPSAGKRGRVAVFGAVNPVSGGPHTALTTKNINKESSLHFLTQLVRYYAKRAPGIPLVIVWDKHPGHTSGLVTEFVKAHPHVTVEETPTQSPDLNPIERLWDWLTDLMMKNDFFERLDALKRAVRHFFCYIAGIKEQVLTCLGDLQKLYSKEAEVEAKI